MTHSTTLIVVFVIVCTLCTGVLSVNPNNPEKNYPQREDLEEPEEVVLKKEDIPGWVGNGSFNQREELHAVGMCWESEMARCVRQCENSTSIEFFQEICASYCQADVTWMCTQLNLAYGGSRVFKFAGRWPFRRIFIFTEAGSCLFCALAVTMHLYYIFEYRSKTNLEARKLEGKVYPYDWMWITMHAIWALTFSCAFMFHVVDIQITEYLDYFTAMMAVLFALYTAIVRVFEIQRTSFLWILSCPFFGFYFFHVIRMTTISFSYGYNMKATITVIAFQATIWILWALKNYWKSRHIGWMMAGQISLFIFSSLEVFDGPPWFGLFDNHAIWHCTIVIIFYFWNRFYIADSIMYRTSNIPKSD